MNDLDKLNESFLNYENALNSHKAVVQEKENRIENFLQDFEKKAREIIAPAFEDILEGIKEKGHTGSIRIKPYTLGSIRKDGSIQTASITLEIFLKGIKKRHKGKEPHIFFNARSDKADSREIMAVYNFFTSGELETGGRISLTRLNQSQENGGQYVLDNISDGIVRSESIKFLSKLLSSIEVIN